MHAHRNVKLTIIHMKTILFRLVCLNITSTYDPLTLCSKQLSPGIYYYSSERYNIWENRLSYRQNECQTLRFSPPGNNTEPTTYHPFDILGYRFTDDGKYYVSKNIELQYGVPKPVFLEYLLQGMKSLYFYETEEDIPIYFVESNHLLVKIDAPKLSKQTTGLQFKNQTDRYIPQLHYAFKDCPSLEPQIDRAHFSRKRHL